MQIEYTLTEKDYIDFNLFHLKISTTMKKSVFVQRLLGPIVYLLAIPVAHFITQISIWYWTLIFSVMSIFAYILYPRQMTKKVERKISKMLQEDENNSLLGRQVIIIDEDQLLVKTAYEEKISRWSGINKITRSDQHIFIYNSSVSAYIIPNTAFTDVDAVDKFYETVNGWIFKAKASN